MTQPSSAGQPGASHATAPERLTLFQRIADKVSYGMGTPQNILIWLAVIIAWVALGPFIANHNFIPAWFTSNSFNFPLNSVTTVLEMFIGYLVGASANRSERNLEATLARLGSMEQANLTLETEQAELLRENTELTQQVHALVVQVAGQTSALEHVNAELNVIRQAVAPGVANPTAGTDSATGAGRELTGGLVGAREADDAGNGRG
jgi:low affinity Fe/Cu permease